MGGGLMQLVAYGAQDIYLTGNPQITFFKVVYRRHTNFSMECIQQTFNGTVGTTASTVTATISRNGDLVHGMHLEVAFGPQVFTGTTYTSWTNNTGHAFINEVELEIGGQRIDKHYGHWLDVWNELTDHDGNEAQLINKFQAKDAFLRSVPVNGTKTITSTGSVHMYVPLKFWFNRNPGLALPLIALQYHEVKVKLTTRGVLGLVNYDGTGTGAASATGQKCVLWADYIFLDTDERRRFAQQSHEYLIEQLQYQQETGAASVKLNLNHPVKELVWTVQHPVVATEATAHAADTLDATANTPGATGNTTAFTANNDYFNYDGEGSGVRGAANHCGDSVRGGVTSMEGFGRMKLTLNGHDRFATRNASYFRTVQPLAAGHRVPSKHVYCYSFALKPEEHQPSGTCNFSRIDNARMVFESNTDSNAPAAIKLTGAAGTASNLNVYAVNYNVLRIMSGMGGLAYSN